VRSLRKCAAVLFGGVWLDAPIGAIMLAALATMLAGGRRNGW
jgi:hypothetical protein